MNNQAHVLKTLEQLNIHHTVISHAPVYTIADCLAIPGLSGEGVLMPRNVFLCNRQKTSFYLMLMQPEMPFRTAVVSKQLGVSRLSFAPEDLLPEYLGLEAGAVSPLGLLFDTEKRVQLVIDRALADLDELVFHPCVNTASVRIPTKDFQKIFLPHTGHVPAWVDCPAEE